MLAADPFVAPNRAVLSNGKQSYTAVKQPPSVAPVPLIGFYPRSGKPVERIENSGLDQRHRQHKIAQRSIEDNLSISDTADALVLC